MAQEAVRTERPLRVTEGALARTVKAMTQFLPSLPRLRALPATTKPWRDSQLLLRALPNCHLLSILILTMMGPSFNIATLPLVMLWAGMGASEASVAGLALSSYLTVIMAYLGGSLLQRSKVRAVWRKKMHSSRWIQRCVVRDIVPRYVINETRYRHLMIIMMPAVLSRNRHRARRLWSVRDRQQYLPRIHEVKGTMLLDEGRPPPDRLRSFP